MDLDRHQHRGLTEHEYSGYRKVPETERNFNDGYRKRENKKQPRLLGLEFFFEGNRSKTMKIRWKFDFKKLLLIVTK